MRCTLPKLFFHFGQRRRRLERSANAAALDTISSGWPARGADRRCMSVKVSIFLPLITITIRSPALKPAACAALPAWTVSTRAGGLFAVNVNTPAKMTIARMKFAIGPAATIAARGLRA